MELTREQIEEYKKSDNLFGSHIVHKLCDMLLAEMDKPKVWENAPEWATKAIAVWYGKDGQVGHSKDYTRELPKSRIDEIAEEAVSKQIFIDGVVRLPYHSLEELIKSAILQARKEWEANR